MPTAAVVSYRLGGTDGVSVEARKWGWALERLGYDVFTVAGEGRADHAIGGLGITPASRAGPVRLESAVIATLAGADLVLAENICSLPLNPVAYRAVTECLRGRCAILHHHDLATQRAHLAHFGLPPDDPNWLHVTVNERSRAELERAGINATVLYNRFDPDPPAGRREELRGALGVNPGTVLLLHPVRAIARKDVPAAVRFAESLAAPLAVTAPGREIVYWLLGPAEDGYGPELEKVLADVQVRVERGLPNSVILPRESQWSADDAYAACDAVVFPSTWEGFGNPVIESATHDRPLVISDYPVARELRAFGFRWFGVDDPVPLAAFLGDPDPALLAHNHEVAREHFALADLPARIATAISARS